MSRLIGYLIPTAGQELLTETSRHAARQAAANGTAHPAPTEEPAAAHCYAQAMVQQDGVIVGLAGRAIWRGVTLNAGNTARILKELAMRFRNDGVGLLAELEGAFALAILESASRRALLAVDRMGVERLTWSQHPGGLVFGTSANAVAGFPGSKPTLRQQALYDFLFMHMVPAPATVYVGISKLPLATALEFADGRITLQRYWTPSYCYAGRSDFPALKSALREGLDTAVNACELNDATGTFLSGGLDSSSVAGTLASLSKSPVRTFTVSFGEADYDELRFARIANRHFGCRAVEHQMTPADIVDAFPRIAAAYDEPFGNSSAAPTYFCAKLAADQGITNLLAGDGGDELFGGNERYVRHSIFEAYQRIPAWLRRTLIEPLTRPFSPEGRLMPLAKLRSYVDQARIPLPERFESWNLMYREGGEGMLDEEFAGAIDPQAPLQRMRDVWASAPSDNRLERMLWFDWQFTLADNDLRKVGTMCELAGVSVSYPMLHPDVVNLSTRIPPDMKIKGIELRHFFKKAMADFLPAEIIAKKKHGFGLPFGLWLKTDRQLAEMIFSHLANLKKRRIIAAEFIDNLIEQHRDGDASYYGYAFWDLAMLEAWLAEHVDR